MSKLEQLIKKYCPDGVEYKKIGEIAEIVRGKRFVHKDDVQEGVPAIHYGELYTHYGISAFETKTHIRNELATKMRYAHTGDVIVVGAGENKIDIGVGVAWLGKDDVAVHDACYILTNHEQNPSFLSYCFRTEEYHKQLFPYVSEGKICSFLKDALEKIEIPIPPLPVQEEIVRILDSFTELETKLETELETELEMRKKQYEYYRDKVLSYKNYDGEVEWVSLEEISTNWFRGNGIKRDEVTDDGQPCVRYGQIYTTYGLHFTECVSHTSSDVIKNPKIAKKGAILFAITGESVEDIATSTAYLGNENIYVGGDILVMEHEQDAKYLSYALSTTDARMQKAKGRIKSKVVHSNKNDISHIVIPIPKDINEQRRIADMLDQFINLIRDMNEDIPAEKELRRKQYEYYRDKLLTFKRLEAV